MNKEIVKIVKQLNKKTGTVYVYENYPYWDKQKKQGRSKRKCIGKIDPSTGEIVPTHKKKNNENDAKIDVKDILKHLEEKISEGLENKELSLTDISLLMSSAVDDVKKKITSDIEEIVKDKAKDDSAKTCEDCGEPLKKTIKKTNLK